MRKYLAVTIIVIVSQMLCIKIANAMLSSDAVLSIELGNSNGNAPPTSGSAFSYEAVSWMNIVGYNGLHLGVSQMASGTHIGEPNGTEMPNIDYPWYPWFGWTGMHQTVSPVTISSDDGEGSVQLDFSGLEFVWSSSGPFHLDSGAWNGNPDGVALMTCQNTCEYGDTYTLMYSATFAADSDLAGVRYLLQLEGGISAIPIPQAIWLFGSGFLGLIGIARRKQA